MPTCNVTKPVLIGRLAVYAPDLATARQVYVAVVFGRQTRHFGTVTLHNGEEFDWVDMASGVMPPYEGRPALRA